MQKRRNPVTGTDDLFASADVRTTPVGHVWIDGDGLHLEQDPHEIYYSLEYRIGKYTLSSAWHCGTREDAEEARAQLAETINSAADVVVAELRRDENDERLY